MANKNVPLDVRMTAANAALKYANALVEFSLAQGLARLDNTVENQGAANLAAFDMHQRKCDLEDACVAVARY